MPKLPRLRGAALAVGILGLLAVAALKSGPVIVGDLPREDRKAIRALMHRSSGNRMLLSALRRGSSDVLADWIYAYRDGDLLRLEV